MENNQTISKLPVDSPTVDKVWRAELELGFEQKADRTILKRRRSVGPLVVQRPFYPGDGVCHVYVLHPPGGIVGGDQLITKVRVDNAHALITTPGASKLYRSHGQYSDQKSELRIEQGSLEWFPQECIAFSGAHAVNKTEVHLSNNATFIGWEVLCLGRPAANEVFEQGQVSMRFDIWRDNKPLLLDRLTLDGADKLLTAGWGLRSYTCSATFIATGVDQHLFDSLRQTENTNLDDLMALTLINDVLVCRYLGHQAEQAKVCFIRFWHRLREALIGMPVSEPRIWNT